MEFFEYIIIAICLFIVVLPFVLKIKGKNKKCSSCTSCPFKDNCGKKQTQNDLQKRM